LFLGSLRVGNVHVATITQRNSASLSVSGFAFDLSGRDAAIDIGVSIRRGRPAEVARHPGSLDLAPEQCGKLEYRVRAYPYHLQLSHRFEMGLMKWL
jgi:hypothetical protein